jgi:LAS superfamily LD-carboxypeptidase LdcB
LAIDILHRRKSSEERMSQVRFENTAEYAWLRENAHNYGFILRYPREYRHVHGYIFEPWHWRFVGVDIATAMKSEGITLYEEFYGRYLAPGVGERLGAAQAARQWQSAFK